MPARSSYAVLAGILAVAVLGGLPALTILLAAIAAIALLEWSRLTDLPSHHLVALEVASLAIMVAVALRGAQAADLLVGGLVLAGALFPVVRPDTTRAIRDFGIAGGRPDHPQRHARARRGARRRAGRGGNPARGRGLSRLRRAPTSGRSSSGKRFGTVPLRPVALAGEDARRA